MGEWYGDEKAMLSFSFKIRVDGETWGMNGENKALKVW